MNQKVLGLPVLAKPSMLRATMAYGGGRGGRALHWLLGDATLPVPRSLYEVLLWPFYVLVLGWGVFLALTASDPIVPILIGSAVVIGLIGLAYPSRRIVGAALIVFWWAVVLVGPAIEGLRVWMGLVALILTGLFAKYADWTERQRDREFHARQAAHEHAKRDQSMAAFLPGPLAALQASVPMTMPGVAGTKTVRSLAIVELYRHFDSQLEASINGTLYELTRYGGWNLGVGIGPFGLSRSTGRGFGDGVLNLGLQGTMHEDWTHENFVAVLETRSGDRIDVVRLIVPSDPSVHEYVQNLLWGWQRDLGIDSAAELLVRRNLYNLPDRVVSDASYVADRLTSILHMEPSARPEVSIVGTAVNEHAILGGAIQFGSDGPWYQLFPVAVVNALVDLTNGRVPAIPPEVTVQLVGNGSEPTVLSTPTPITPAVDGQLAARLTVSTVGQFSLQLAKDDLTNDLIHKPVTSFLWQYLLARTVRNPRDVISRAALADEVFPALDPKLQRTRLRQRLSDIQTSLVPALASCVVSDGERVRFNAEGADVDAINLRTAVTALGAAKSPLDEPQLKSLEELVSGVGDGIFLPEWEGLEQKVSAGRSSASTVVEEARADVDRWRAAVLVGIADGYSARGRQGAAIPYLERVVRNHPQNELATKKLIAAYLETGQSERARQVQESKTALR